MAVDPKVGGLVKVAEDTYCQVSPRGEGNQGIFLTQEGSVLIDGFIKHCNAFMASLDSLNKASPVRYVVNTHDDGDHYSLNHIFRRKEIGRAHV